MYDMSESTNKQLEIKTLKLKRFLPKQIYKELANKVFEMIEESEPKSDQDEYILDVFEKHGS